MPDPTPELTKVERGALAVLRAANENASIKRFQRKYLYGISAPWMRKTIHRRTYVVGLDWMPDFRPERGVLLAANHRSLFDQYAAMLAMEQWGVPWTRRLYFPVRANFFYESPLGILINLAVGGGAMYPPVYRDREKASLNDQAMDRLVAVLKEPGTVVGMHPEGTRGNGPDPYELLPAQPGVGKVILRSQPTVIPLFINGLGNGVAQEAKRNYERRAREKHTIIMCFGQPVDYSEFTAAKPRLALYKRCADRVRAAIIELGERERVLRDRCTQGRMPADDPGWWRS